MSAVVPAGQTLWLDLFQGLFHANTPAWGQTLFAWGQLFHAEGRSNSELVSAVYAITRRNPMPQFPTQFLEALRDELRQQDRSMSAQAESRRLDDTIPVQCDTCSDSGWVCGLPHLSSVWGPEWRKPRTTMAVTCFCSAGEQLNARAAGRQTDPKSLMSFIRYSAKNPHYQTQMDTRAVEVNAELKTHEQEKGPPQWRATVEAMLRRYQHVDERAEGQSGQDLGGPIRLRA
jgi:hypothetical protein